VALLLSAAAKPEQSYFEDSSQLPSEQQRVLVLGETELNFFMLAGTGVCSGFMLKRELIIQGCFHYC